MDNQVHHTANRKAIVGICKFFGAVILIGGIVYSEILFLGIVGALFPSGPMAIGAMLGAVTTGASILLLVLSKSAWFRPGTQLAVAWIFTGVEVAILILNDILAYQIHQGGQLDQYMAAWRLFCVAAPVVSVVGWILCFYFDPQRSIEHKRMEMEDDQARAQIDFETSMHQKVLSARYKAANTVGVKLEAIIEGSLEHSYRLAAAKLAARVASDLTGEHVSHLEVMGNSPKQIQGRVVESEPAKAAHTRQKIDPHKVKPQVDSEKKEIEEKESLLNKFHGGIDKLFFKGNRGSNVADGELESPVDYEEEYEEEEIEEEEKPILEEKPGQEPRTRRLGGSPELEAQEDEQDLMELPIDQRWKEYTSLNAETPTPTPKKGKGGRKPKNVQGNQGG